MESESATMTTCAKCDAERSDAGQLGRIGTPCDICAGTRRDYLCRPCRHCQLPPRCAVVSRPGRPVVADPFCVICGVSLDLHPSGEQNEEPWECGIAARKAELIDAFFLRRGGGGRRKEGR